MTRTGSATTLGAAALVTSIAMSAYLALAPLIPKRVITVSGSVGSVHARRASLFEAAGWPILAALVVIVGVTAVPLLVRTRAAFLGAAGALAVVSAVTWSTVGPYLLAPAVLLLVAGLVATPRQPGTS